MCLTLLFDYAVEFIWWDFSLKKIEKAKKKDYGCKRQEVVATEKVATGASAVCG